MGMIATLLDFVRTQLEGAHVSDVKIDPGGGATRTAQHFSDPGDDSHPRPEDLVATTSSDGREHVVGYVDPKNQPKSAVGEKRIYSRDGDGVMIAEIWLKADGTVAISNANGGVLEMAPGGDVTINGVTIDTGGNVSAPGEVTAMAAAAPVNVSTHFHPDAIGQTGSPTPGS